MSALPAAAPGTLLASPPAANEPPHMTAVRRLNIAMTGLLCEDWARALVRSLAQEAASALAQRGFALDGSGLTELLHRSGGAEQSLDVSGFVLDSLTGETYQLLVTLLAIGAVPEAGSVLLKLQIERYRPKRFELPLSVLVAGASLKNRPLIDREDYVTAYCEYARNAVALDEAAQRDCAARFAQALSVALEP